MIQNPYQPINAEIVDIIDESPTIKSFVAVPEEPMPFKTGQFVELTLPGEGEAPGLSRPSPGSAHRRCRCRAEAESDTRCTAPGMHCPAFSAFSQAIFSTS